MCSMGATQTLDENRTLPANRWKGIVRPYDDQIVAKLRGSLRVAYTIATCGALRLWDLLHTEPFVPALGALTGNQAVQMVRAGLEAIYCSGWQVAGDANTAGQTYPDQSLYPADSVPALVRRINHALQRADQVAHLGRAESAGPRGTDWFAPIVADAEAGFGGDLNAFELMKAMIEAGAAGVHFEDQLASAKKCGHMGGKVLVPTREFVQKLQAARLASDLLDVPVVLVARTDANSAKLITSDVDPRDRAFLTGARTPEGFFELKGGLDAAIARGLAYAPYADLLWCETSHADLDEARRFASAIHSRFPGKLLAYNCSPSFNWSGTLDAATIGRFQDALGEIGYAFPFLTLTGLHSLTLAMFELAREYRERGMTAYARLQDKEFEVQGAHGYAAVKHQSFVGTGWFDELAKVISHGETSTAALTDSTEAE